MNKKEIIDAYCKIREIDNTIPDDILDFMKDAALSAIDHANELNTLKEAVKNLIYGHRAFITFDSDDDGLKYKTALENVKKLITN